MKHEDIQTAETIMATVRGKLPEIDGRTYNAVREACYEVLSMVRRAKETDWAMVGESNPDDPRYWALEILAAREAIQNEN